MIQQSFNPPNMSDFQKRALIVGIVFLVVLVASAFVNSHHFFESYLIGWTFWTGITTGSLRALDVATSDWWRLGIGHPPLA